MTSAPAAARPVLDRTFAAVLFDMDGTLISSIDAVVRSWRRWAQEYAVPAERFTGFGGLHGIPARTLVEMLLPEHTDVQRAGALHRITELEILDTDGIAVLPGAREALDALAAGGASAIVTSCGRDLAWARVRAAGLTAPSAVVTAEDVRHGKPDPEPFRAGAALLGVDPRDCLVIEDAEAGLAAGRAAGAACVGLRTTHPEGHPSADLVVDDLAALRFEATADGVRVTRA